jgi:transcriptional regulator with XRE-family HTH domain
MDVAAFLARLWQLQRVAGLTNAALAERIGVHEATISRLRRGEREQPHLTTLLGAINAFPELAVFVGGDLRQRTTTIPTRKSKEAS